MVHYQFKSLSYFFHLLPLFSCSFLGHLPPFMILSFIRILYIYLRYLINCYVNINIYNIYKKVFAKLRCQITWVNDSFVVIVVVFARLHQTITLKRSRDPIVRITNHIHYTSLSWFGYQRICILIADSNGATIDWYRNGYRHWFDSWSWDIHVVVIYKYIYSFEFFSSVRCPKVCEHSTATLWQNVFTINYRRPMRPPLSFALKFMFKILA